MLETTIANVKLNSVLMNASGCLCTTEDELNNLFNSNSGCVVSKSSTLIARDGNPKPRLNISVDHNGMNSINSMGLPNLGYKFYTEYGMKNKSKPYIQSLYSFSLDEFSEMASYIDNTIDYKQLIELNVSCPNLINKSTKTNFDVYESYMELIKQNQYKNLIIGFKMAPLYESTDFDNMSNLLLKYNVPFITCINSIPNGLYVDHINETTVIYPKNGLGGVGGSAIKPTALSNVYNYYKRLNNKVDIIGCGGITTGIDAFEHILCGAKAVQIGTNLMWEEYSCFDRIGNELIQIMKDKKYESIHDFYGKIKNIEPNNDLW